VNRRTASSTGLPVSTWNVRERSKPPRSTLARQAHWPPISSRNSSASSASSSWPRSRLLMSLWTGDRRSLRCPPRILFLFLSICPELEFPLFKIHAIHRRSDHRRFDSCRIVHPRPLRRTLTVTSLSDTGLGTSQDQIAIASSGEKGRGNQVSGSFVQRPAEGETS
jgi:hypothetical protein